MGVHSGQFGCVNGQSTTRQWTLNDVGSPTAFKASNTRIGTARRKGVRDWNGSFGNYGALPLIMPRDKFTFLGYTAPSDDEEGGAGTTYSGPAIVDNVAITWNWETNAIISHTVNFSGDGVLAEGTGTYADASDIDAPETADCYITIGEGSSGSGSGLPTTSATLTISAANSAYVNALTARQRKRKQGTIDWTLALNLQEDSGIALPFNIDDNVIVNCFTNALEFWYLKWGIIRDFSGITSNAETGDIIGMTVNIDMQAEYDGAIGEISKPGGDQWWPIVAT